MGSLTHKNQGKNISGAIPETSHILKYAREYKREWQYIRWINKEFKYFEDNIFEVTCGLFQNPRVNRLTKNIKKFDLYQKKGKFKDISDKEILAEDVCYIIKMKKNFNNFDQYINFVKEYYDEDDQAFIDPYPGFKNIYDVFELFFSKLKIKYKEVIFIESESESDSDSDVEVEFILPDSDVEVEFILPDSDSDSDYEVEFNLPDSDSD